MAGISNEEINDIQKQANIVDIIGSYVDLEKKGNTNFFSNNFNRFNKAYILKVLYKAKYITSLMTNKTSKYCRYNWILCRS